MRAQPQTELTQLRELVATLQAALEQSRQENGFDDRDANIESP